MKVHATSALVIVALTAGCFVPSSTLGAPPAALATAGPPVFRVEDHSGGFAAALGIESPAASGCSGTSAGVVTPTQANAWRLDVRSNTTRVDIVVNASSPVPTGFELRLCLYGLTDQPATVVGPPPLSLSRDVTAGANDVGLVVLPNNAKPTAVSIDVRILARFTFVE